MSDELERIWKGNRVGLMGIQLGVWLVGLKNMKCRPKARQVESRPRFELGSCGGNPLLKCDWYWEASGSLIW